MLDFARDMSGRGAGGDVARGLRPQALVCPRYRLTCRGAIVVESVDVADRWHRRLRGLLGRRSLGPGRGMYLAPCSAVHTFFMQFSLDLFFLGREGHVLKLVRYVGPGRMVVGGLRAHAVVELEAGWLAEDAITIGDRLEIVAC